MRVAERIATGLLALAIMVPLATWLSVDALQERADGVLTAATPSFPERLDRARGLLGDAAERTPSAAPELMLVQALIFGQRPAAAAAVAREVARREPENVTAWELLAVATERIAPAQSRRARDRVERLKPPVGG